MLSSAMYHAPKPEKIEKRKAYIAGDYVDGQTEIAIRAAELDVFRTLANNDAYHALQAVDGLIITGATCTNVNDVAVALVE